MPEVVQKLIDLGVCNARLEPTYDRICRLAKRTAGTAIATISFFDGTKHWLKAKQNYTAEYVPAEESFCSKALESDDVFWVRDAAADDRFRHLGAVVDAGLRFYAAAPVRFWDGRRIGNVCVLDPEPRDYDPELAQDLADLARVVTDELALKQAERRQSEALEERAAAQASQNRLLSVLSHEFRTPLNGAVGAASVLSKTVTDRGSRELVSVVEESCGKLSRLVDSLLAYTSAQEDEFELTIARHDVRLIVGDALALVAPAARRRGVSLLRSERGPLPLVEIDAQRLGQILFNLLSNAAQHSDGGTVRVETTWRAPDRLQILVRDSGSGVSPERLAGLFEPFNRDPANTDTTSALGLGLATTRRLAVIMGGDVQVESGPAGCVFRVDVRAPAADGSAELSPSGFAGKRVLIVDDHPANLIVQSRLLQALGFETTTCDNAEDALLATGRGTFDLVLTDINMPGVDGYQFVERLRSQGGWRAEAPVFAVSASMPPSGVQQQPPPGFDGWLTKPVDLTKLGAAFAPVFARKSAPLWRVLYVSRRAPHAIDRGETIAKESTAANGRDAITGVLAEWNGWFAQVLEGPRAEVERTFTRIARDPRHEDLTLIASRACHERRFDRWSMIGARLDDGDVNALALFRAEGAPSPASLSESALMLLLELAEQQASVVVDASSPQAVHA